MSRTLKGSSGYEGGQGRTFTPSVGSNWTDDFNQLMFDTKKSRNEVTEMLIVEALDIRKGLGTSQGNLELTLREIQFLRSPIGRKLISDYATMYYGNSAISEPYANGNYQVSAASISDSFATNTFTESNSSNTESQHTNASSQIQHEVLESTVTPDHKDLEVANKESEESDIRARVRRELAAMSGNKVKTQIQV